MPAPGVRSVSAGRLLVEVHCGSGCTRYEPVTPKKQGTVLVWFK